MNASESGFEFIDDAKLRSWYLHDGQIPIPTLKRAYTEEMIKEGQMQTPLQLVALIQQGHSIIHKPWWTQVYLPMFCPTNLALEEMYKHWFYSVKRNEGRVHNFSLASKKMAFHLGYTVQVFWILATKRPSCALMVADPKPMHFLKAKPNIKYLANFFGMLCLKLWQQRLCATPGQEKVKVPKSFQMESWPSWKNSKGSMDNWRDLEGALATLWRMLLFTHGDTELREEETGPGLEFPFYLGKLRDWEFIHLSAEEEAWFGISGDGPGTMSPLALGLKEAERVQRHWEKEKKWVDPMYPAEWEGWTVI